MIDQQERKILSLRQQGRAQTHRSIYDEYTIIGKERYQFQWQTVCQKRIHIMLPSEFVDLPLEIARLKYPSENRPGVIKSSLDTSVNFAFSYRQKAPDEEYAAAVAKAYAAVIHKMYPANEFLKSNTLYRDKKSKKLLSWYEYKSPDIKEKIYNRHGYMNVEGTLMQIIFTCPETVMEHWRPVALEVFLSVYSDLDRQVQQR